MKGSRLNVPAPYKYMVLWTVKHHYSNRPAHSNSMYFIVTLFAVLYIPEVSTVFSGTQYRLNYGVYFQTIHPAVQLGNNYIVGSINISLPAPGASIESYHIIDPCKTFFERSGGSKVIHHHIHDCSRMVRLTKELNNLRLKIVSKVKNTLVSIQRIIATTPNPTPTKLHQDKRSRRSSSGLLPFIGELSNVLFGTATEKDVRNQQVGVDKAVQIGNINARELNYLGNALKQAMVIHKENLGFNLEAVMANTGAVQNISMAFGRYTVRKHIEEELLSSTRKLQLILLQLDLQVQLLISDVIALKNGVLRPTLVTYDEMLQFMGILSAHLTDKQFRLPTVSEMFQSVRLYTTPALVGNVLIVTLRVPLHNPSKSFSLLKSTTFPLPIHGHLSQIVGIPKYVIVSRSQIGLPDTDTASRCEYMSDEYNCHVEVPTQPLAPTDCLTSLILNSVKGVKQYCQFKLLIQHVPSPTRVDYLLHGHYLLTNVLNMSVTCDTSSNVQVIKGCSSCLYNFPCDCTLRTSNLTFSTHRHPCENTPSTKPALIGFTVNLGVLQLINMSLAQLIDPGLLFSRPLGLTSSEHSGRLLGISSNYVIRQAEIFKHAKENSITLEAYIKQITMSQKQFDQQRRQLHQSSTQFTLPEGTHSYVYWANLVCSFLFTPITLIVVIVNCRRLRNLQQKSRRAVLC